MKAGLPTSIAIHALVLTWGLWSLSAPESFQVDDVEALPIELVDITEFTQVQEGAKDAPKDGPAAPEPVTAPQDVPDAVNIGEQKIDQSTPATEQQKQVEVKETSLPKPSEVPVPRPAPREEPQPVVQEEPKPETAPATEVAPVPAPKEEVKPDPVEEAIAAAETEPLPAEEPKNVELPADLPLPEKRPEPAKAEPARQAETPPAQTAKTPERKNEENRKTESAAAQKNTEQPTTDEVASLLNKEKGSGGGAKASDQQASAGAKKSTGGTKLTQSEMDSLRGQIQACWNPPAGVVDAAELTVSVRFSLSPEGKVEGRPSVTKSSGNKQADESAIRAVSRCGQNGYQLPADKYDAWQDVVVNFDPSEMF